MAIQVYPSIYKHEIPLPNNPLKALNSYIILSKDRNLIIDTGFNNKECKDFFMKSIQDMNMDLSKTSLLITHLHSDHSGLAGDLNKKGVKVYAGKTDAIIINEMIKKEYWNKIEEYKKMFDLEKYNISFDDNPGYKYRSKNRIEFISLIEGDVLNIGDYSFKVIDIPGHTPGHIGLYEEKHKIFFGGDHILDKITPNIGFWGFDTDVLSTYFSSLKKVYEYDIEYLFTSHRNIITNHKKRIDELLDHHEKRLKEILEILKYGEKTVKDVAANMHWSLRCNTWEDFPKPQKWFASSEAMAHLEHLVFIKKVEKSIRNGILYYSLINN